jgi:hypothetical protein
MNQATQEACANCEAVGEGTSAWGGWCHDCDNQEGGE